MRRLRIDILSLFPEYFKGPFESSIIKRAVERGIIDINLLDIREFSKDKHKRIDDRPYGGGAGMVMMAEPVCDAIRSVRDKSSHVIFLSPQGSRFDSKKAKALSKKSHLVLLCGHYEGIDERVMDEVDEEISIGDYVLTNGCIASIVLVDATVRFVPEVLGNSNSIYQDSFDRGLLGAPCYTRPREFENKKVPEVLLNGDHSKIEEERREQALEKTRKVRPDLYKLHKKKNKERSLWSS